MVRHRRRVFVEAVDFITTLGFGRDGTGRPERHGKGPTLVITDLGLMVPDPVSHELVLTAVHPGVDPSHVAAETGWDLAVSPDLAVTEAPSPRELAVLRDLKQRTAEAHGG
jgi:glutaconate CoA-transferase subunit B